MSIVECKYGKKNKEIRLHKISIEYGRYEIHSFYYCIKKEHSRKKKQT